MPPIRPAADQPVFDRQVVLRLEVPGNELADAVALPHEPLPHLPAEGLPPLAALHPHLGEQEKALPAVQILIGVGLLLPLQGGIKPADAHAVRQGDKVLAPPVEAVGQEHAARVAHPGLEGMKIHLALPGINLQQELGGLADAGDGLIGVPAPQHGKIGHRVQLKEVGTGDHKEVTHHQVGGPDDLQLGQAVKHIEGLPARPCNDLMDSHRKLLKPLPGIQMAYLQPLLGLEQGG